jgi:3-hydroxyacyl-CoA dehydrogenase/enoyl-CoA hydratase/3-hydroxybutyryl-CoA epimerase
MQDFRYDKDADGIVTVTMDMQGQGANTMNAAWLSAMEDTLARLRAESGLTGVVFTSAKKTFFAGGDLKDLLAIERADAQTLAFVERNKAPLRALEKLAVPVVAAINGAALGGGFELCLACNRRIVVDAPHAVVGQPEVTLGLLPGAGGIVRMVALLGLEKALPLLLEGRQLKPADALAAGLVHEVVPTVDALVPAAKAWIRANPGAHQQPWDTKGFKYPGGGATSPAVRQIAVMAPVMLKARTRGLVPAPERIVDLAVNSMRMGFDAALRAESRGLVALIPTREAKAAITTFFFGMQAIRSGKVRPAGEPWRARSSAVLGAGMMGGGIAWAHASKRLPTVLKDTTADKAAQGKAYSEGLADQAIRKGRLDAAGKAELLARITPVTDDAAFDGTDLIIEAVFEDIALKERVIAETFPRLGPDGIFGSNTSTLPISILAEACPDPSRFIGLHFFSPVDKMKVVEIILGRRTSEATLRKAYDVVQQIGYLPIIVNDARGFFTSRVFGTFMDEGLQLLEDGLAPAAIERAAWLAGMPVGPLAVHDEVSMELSRKALQTHRALDERLGVRSGFGAANTATQRIAPTMCELGRAGRHWGGAGFYDYPADGRKRLWPGLSQFRVRDAGVTVSEAVDRLLYRQAIETLRCLHEGVLRSEVEANLGSIMAIGFPALTGGALQFIRGIGLEAFARRAAELADRVAAAAGDRAGDRFRVDPAALEALRQRSPLMV